MDSKTAKRAAIAALIFPLLFAFCGASTLDPLRGLRSELWSIDAFTRFAVLALAVVVFAISLLAYKRLKTRRFLVVTTAFGAFALKAVLQVTDIFWTPGYFVTDPIQNILDFIVIALLCVAIFKK